MARKGSGLGFVMLLVVLAVALLLTARAWERIGTTAVTTTDPRHPAVPREGERAAAAQALKELPGLKAAQQAADAHAKDVDEALETEREGDGR